MAVRERPGLRALLWTEARAVDRGSTVDRGRDRAGARGGGAGRGGAMAGLTASLLRSAMGHEKRRRGHGHGRCVEPNAARASVAAADGRNEGVTRRRRQASPARSGA